MYNTDFNLISAAAVWEKNKKVIFLFTLCSGLIATITVFIITPQFKSKAIVIPANTKMADKTSIFGKSLQELNAYTGSGSDLDRLEGIALMDVCYEQLVDSFPLIQYYQLRDDDTLQLKRSALLKLKKDIHVQQTEQDQLVIWVWMTNKQLSADIVNALVNIVQQKGRSIWQNQYSLSAKAIQETIEHHKTIYQQLSDSTTRANTQQATLLNLRINQILEQIKEYQNIVDAYRVMSNLNPPVLHVLQPATPAAKAERPDKAAIIATASFVGMLFGLFITLIRNRQS